LKRVIVSLRFSHGLRLNLSTFSLLFWDILIRTLKKRFSRLCLYLRARPDRMALWLCLFTDFLSSIHYRYKSKFAENVRYDLRTNKTNAKTMVSIWPSMNKLIYIKYHMIYNDSYMWTIKVCYVLIQNRHICSHHY
jgi:hypothetical protein